MNSGHWFCSFCNDVISFRAPNGRWDLKAGEECPVCHNRSMGWVKHVEGKRPARLRMVTQAEAAKRFQEIREAL